VSRSILGMPTFREPCSSLQGEEQPDTELFLQAVPLTHNQTKGSYPFFYMSKEQQIGRILNKHNIRTKRPGGTAQYQAASRPDEMDCKIHETLAYQEWIWTRRKPAKRIIFIYRIIEKYRTPLIFSVRMHFGENVQ
ncbi:hypothetical protein ALC57_00188, partial [Trachymyrmex cornetzi]